MKNVYVLIFFWFSTYSSMCFSQGARVGMNNNVYLVIDNAAKVVIENPNSNALWGTGKIVTENEFDQLIWRISNSTGVYNVPLAKQNGSMLTAGVVVTSAGSSGGALKFSTYGTNNLNLPWASGVTNMTVVNPIAMDGSLYVVDRFYFVVPDNYSTKPGVTLKFMYDITEIGGSNVIDEATLKMQRWNGSWDNVAFGTSDVPSKTVTASISPANFYGTWILESSAIPLNISYSSIDIRNDNCMAQILFNDLILDGLSRVKISKSKDGESWDDVGVIEECSGDVVVFYDENPFSNLSYYKVENIDENGQVELLEIISFNNNCEDELVVFPNPVNDLVYIENGQNHHLEIFDASSKLVKKFDLQEHSHQLDVSALERGIYLFRFTSSAGHIVQKKITVM